MLGARQRPDGLLEVLLAVPLVHSRSPRKEARGIQQVTG
jgi:hypothetical protein